MKLPQAGDVIKGPDGRLETIDRAMMIFSTVDADGKFNVYTYIDGVGTLHEGTVKTEDEMRKLFVKIAEDNAEHLRDASGVIDQCGETGCKH